MAPATSSPVRPGEDSFFLDPDGDNDKATDLRDEVFADDLDFILGA